MQNLTLLASNIEQTSQKQQVQIDQQGAAIARVEDKQEHFAAKLNELEKTVAKQATETAELQRELLVAKSTATVPPIRAGGPWDRELDGTVFRLSAGAIVARAEFEALMEKILVDANIPRVGSHAPVFRCTTKNPFGRSFHFQCEGLATTAARFVSKVWGALRSENGVWKNYTVEAQDGANVRAYGALDSSPKQAAEERIGKKFARFLQRVPALEKRHVEFNKARRTIIVDWRDVARITCPERDKNEIMCGKEALTQLGITPQAIHAHFREAIDVERIGEAANPTVWESCI